MWFRKCHKASISSSLKSEISFFFMNYPFKWSPATSAANKKGDLVCLKTQIRPLVIQTYVWYWQPPPAPVCYHLFSSPKKTLPLCLFLDVLNRQGQFQADLRVNTPEPSKVSLSCTQHLSPSHAPCHPQSLVCLPVLCHWLYSSLPVPRLLKATCQFSWLTHKLPIPLLLTPLPFNLNMTRV